MDDLLNSSNQHNPESENYLGPALCYTLGTLMILTAIVTILGNLLVIIIIMRSPKIQTITSGFLLNLAIADLTTGILLLPFASAVHVHQGWIYSEEWCGILGFVYLVVGIVSTWTLASLSMERYIAVNQPLKYHQILTKSRVWITILLNWGFAVFMASVPFMSGSNYTYLPTYGFCLPDFFENGVASIVILTTGICLPFVIMCLAYISIGRVACTQARRKVIECNEDHCVYVTPKNKDYRAAKILAALAGVFAICWLPFTFLCSWDTSGQHSAPTLLTSVVFWFTLLSSAINPWLYSILNRTFRAAMQQLVMQAVHKLPLLRNHFRVGPEAAATAQGGNASLEMTECRDTQGKWNRRSGSQKENDDAHTNERTTHSSSMSKKQVEEGQQKIQSSQHITAVQATIEVGETAEV
ncbi:probable G-protein coupled receptor No9 [Lytechinus variegatus]|uniref:probable G-protein coupled receptor No9 n=1 Tax=Lytechinus variegatus TaxID=7654 RepID=UPI001BB21697|nr:probable G-protein coupled receptor No9 [Lytechinus variegatus]